MGNAQSCAINFVWASGPRQRRASASVQHLVLLAEMKVERRASKSVPQKMACCAPADHLIRALEPAKAETLPRTGTGGCRSFCSSVVKFNKVVHSLHNFPNTTVCPLMHFMPCNECSTYTWTENKRGASVAALPNPAW